MANVVPLPNYPSTAARKSLSASQLATLYQTISTRLAETISLPPAKRDTDATRSFITSYAQDTAVQALQPLIWPSKSTSSKAELTIRQRALTLAEKLALSSPGLSLQTLLDLSIIYAPIRPSQMRTVVETALKTTPALIDAVRTELVPAFTLLLGDSTGLYGVRKSAYCILSFLQVATHDIIRAFSTKEFLISLAKCYDQGMASVATSYGGLASLRGAEGRELDDWERIWVETKVDLLDAFHVIFSTIVRDMSSASGRALGIEAERAFDVVFALIEISYSASHSTPFLDRSLLADYQQSYNLAKILSSALKHAEEKDARLDLLEDSLREFDDGRKDAGVLKLIIKSSGVPPNLRRGTTSNAKGKERAHSPPPPPALDPDIDLKVSQVLDIFPDHSPSYIRALLGQPSYPTVERVIEALLEGAAPTEDELLRPKAEPIERRNVFDDEVIDVSTLHVGKKSEDASVVLRDRTFIEQMKADIIRRAEIISISDSEEEDDRAGGEVIVAFDEEADLQAVKVGGDGEESDADDDEEEHAAPTPSIETILELAYIRDPKLFDRDAATRRSKTRQDLRSQTGWDDNQIEGWRIMLERNPKKDKILQKHEFSGNQPIIQPEAGSSRGGRGGGRGRGRGGRGAGGSNDPRERSLKDKHKASRGNHNRKRGHDKKMARAGPPPS